MQASLLFLGCPMLWKVERKMVVHGKSVWPCRFVARLTVSEHLPLWFSGSIFTLEK
jgi:hypothetical protein